MSVSNGQNANQDTFNAAFVSKTTASTMAESLTANKQHILKHIATPSAPASGHTALYAKADGRVYRRAFGEAEAEVGGSGGGGGSSLEPYDGAFPPPTERVTAGGLKVYDFEKTDEQGHYYSIAIPDTYIAGNPIILKGGQFFGSPTSGDVMWRATTSIFRAGISGESTPNGHSSTIAAQTVAGSTNQIVTIDDVDLTDGDGEIDSVPVAPGDRLVIRWARLSTHADDTLAGVASFVKNSFQLKTTP